MFNFPKNYKKGFGLLELVLAIGIFTAGIAGAFVLLFSSQSFPTSSSKITKAVFLAEEGIEALRSIRSEDFLLLVNGTYGLVFSNNKWNLGSNPDTTDGFTRTITISNGDNENTKRIDSLVTWEALGSPQKQVVSSEYLTYWTRPPETEIECFLVNLLSTSIDSSSNHIIRNIQISNNCDEFITFDKMILTWNNSVMFQKARISNKFVWQGSVPSGTLVDIDNTPLLPNSAPLSIDQLHWEANHSMLGVDINVEFIMIDGSSQEFSIPSF